MIGDTIEEVCNKFTSKGFEVEILDYNNGYTEVHGIVNLHFTWIATCYNNKHIESDEWYKGSNAIISNSQNSVVWPWMKVKPY